MSSWVVGIYLGCYLSLFSILEDSKIHGISEDKREGLVSLADYYSE